MMAMVVVARMLPPVVIMAIPAMRWRTMMVPPGRWIGRRRRLPVGPIDHRRRVIAVARAAVKGGHGTAEINPDIHPCLGLVGDEGGGDAAEQKGCKDVGCFHDGLRDVVLVWACSPSLFLGDSVQTDTIIGAEIGLSRTLQDNLFSGGGYHQTGAWFGGKGWGDQQGEADDQAKGVHGGWFLKGWEKWSGALS